MIDVSHLTFTYEGNAKETLHDLSFSVKSGEIFGFLGPSGAGKSTTQKILFGLLKDYTGSVRIMDKEIKAWDSRIYEQIGISFELPNHYTSLTALENLDYFKTLYAGDGYEPRQVLEWVGLADAADTRVQNFSKGMMIRLNVARSILHNPRILFLDEPTSGLDPVNARVIKDLVLRLRDEGATVFVTTHSMTLADELCDQVAFITGGAIRAMDAPEALKKKYGKRSVMVGYLEDGELNQAEFPIEGLGTNDEFIGLLNSGHSLETIHSQETTLEDVFIRVTGEELG